MDPCNVRSKTTSQTPLSRMPCDKGGGFDPSFVEHGW